MAWAPGATSLPISERWSDIIAVLTVGSTRAALVARCGQTAPNR
jgi:hypothetical protein